MADKRLNLTSAQFTHVSEKIHARPLASRIHRLVRLQIASPLAYIIGCVTHSLRSRLDIQNR